MNYVTGNRHASLTPRPAVVVIPTVSHNSHTSVREADRPGHPIDRLTILKNGTALGKRLGFLSVDLRTVCPVCSNYLRAVLAMLP